MPLSAVVSDQILCMHGGLSSELLAAKSLDVINTIERPLKVSCVFLWPKNRIECPPLPSGTGPGDIQEQAGPGFDVG